MLARDNPWWTDPQEVKGDADLRRLKSQAVRFEYGIPFDLETDAVYTLRGPRQVGKSTLLKTIVAKLIKENETPPRNILYLDVEGTGINNHTQLQNAVLTYLGWLKSSQSDGRIYLMLDEVTGVKDWGSAIRVLYRRGNLDGVTVIVTGSHALDIMRGGETAPGRRGERTVNDLDWILMPVSFRTYVKAHAPETIKKLPLVDIFNPEAAYNAAREIGLYDSIISPLFNRYLRTGGYPHAVATEHEDGLIPVSVYQLYRDAITGQMKRAHHRDSIFREIVSWAGYRRLGKEFSWRDVSADTDIGSKDTARTYIEDAEAMFLWSVFYRTQDISTPVPALRSPKKLYPSDPFTWHVLASWAMGETDPWTATAERIGDPIHRGDLVESIMADHIRRSSGPHTFYHRTLQGQEEIDFVTYAEGKISRIEVKYRKRIVPADERYLEKYGGGIIASADELGWNNNSKVARIPISWLLAGWKHEVTLFPARR